MRVQVVSRAGVEWEGEASSVTVPSTDGDMGILPGHTPLVVLLRDGQVLVDHNGVEQKFNVSGDSFATVDSDLIYVVVGRAEAA